MFWVVWAIAIVVVVGLIWFWWYQKNESLAARLAKLSVETPGQVVVASAPGKLPDNFSFDSDWPDGSNPNILSSYVSYYTSSTVQQVTVTYLSKLSYIENVTAFPLYFQRHGWTVASGGASTSLAYYNVAKNGMTNQIVIAQMADGVHVTDSEFSPNGDVVSASGNNATALALPKDIPTVFIVDPTAMTLTKVGKNASGTIAVFTSTKNVTDIANEAVKNLPSQGWDLVAGYYPLTFSPDQKGYLVFKNGSSMVKMTFVPIVADNRTTEIYIQHFNNS